MKTLRVPARMSCSRSPSSSRFVEALLVAAAARTRQVLAFTYPRDRWYVRTMFALGNFWLRLTGKKFRAFVHPPERMAAVLEAAGLVRATRRNAIVWTLDLYCRGELSGATR
jgi:hypothetical protein